jgi:DUF1680 family protein
LRAMHRQMRETGRIAGIDPNYRPGDRDAHKILWDSDAGKWIEAAAYVLATHPDPEVEAWVDEMVDLFEKGQMPDGYINSFYTAVEPENQWKNLRDNHEMYNNGHLIEGAVAYYLATGKRKLLDIVCKCADNIDSRFGPEEGKRRGYPGHEEIEIALVKLYKVTGNKRYLNLASFFIDERGRQPHYYDIESAERGEAPRASYEYQQAHKPVREQTKVVGHSVRAMYLYTAMMDVAKETNDQTLIDACKILWKDMVSKQLYITAGLGQTQTYEGFTFEYDFPEETAYCETCATVGLAFWALRMLQVEKDAHYADVMERALYNGSISGVSLSGDRFFYVNPLATHGNHHRQEWFRCACCPPNLARMIATLGQYVYSQSDDEAWVHLYAQGDAVLEIGGREVKISQKTNYPWDGEVELTVESIGNGPLSFTLALRIPGWSKNATLKVNGAAVDLQDVTEKGYAKITREWRDGDKVALSLAMPVERVYANPKVRMLNGKVALQRGPIVYCLEEVDNKHIVPLNRISLPRTSGLTTEFRPDLLGGVVVIKGDALVVGGEDWGQDLYRYEPSPIEPCTFTAVPYCVWDNREPGHMLVWMRETV